MIHEIYKSNMKLQGLFKSEDTNIINMKPGKWWYFLVGVQFPHS
jgi:hypothetical protein